SLSRPRLAFPHALRPPPRPRHLLVAVGAVERELALDQNRARGAASVPLRGPAAGARLRPARPLRAAAAAAPREPGGGALDRPRRLPPDRGGVCRGVDRAVRARLGG